ncbi:MAG: prolipoprotein diacylglyceryl transferase [Polyangiaceae bacterium]|nr:prolipoprotein diacylglyceryl transferase [Polyangiaceae bacterium]
MQGRLFTLFDTGFPSYFVLLLVGFVFATSMGALWARRLGHNPDVIVDLGVAMLIAGVLGARILHVIADGHFMDYVHLCTDPSKVDWLVTQGQCTSADYGGVWDAARKVCHPVERDCFRWAEFWAGGLTYYGGFIGAALVAVRLLRVDKFPFWRAADMAGLVVPVGLGFGRMGCLLAGCCFGSPTPMPIGLSFPSNSPASEAQFKAGSIGSPLDVSLPVHPTQIYESFGSFAIAAFLILYFHGRKRYDGHVFVMFVLLYAALRFVLEFWRDDERGGLLGLSTSQLIGVGLAAAAILVHRRLRASGASPSKIL